MKSTITAAALAFAPFPLWAEPVTKPSPMSVSETMDGLEKAVTAAGATVFARVDHAEGAAGVDMQLPDATLLIFGNPQLGTLAMQQDIHAGLVLPLRVLAYTDESGNTQLYWHPAEDLFSGLDIPLDAEVISNINQALQNLTDQAVGAI